MITSLLIANRGEIAWRIMRTARAMGIRTIAVHSDVDANMPFVREADEAVLIGPAPARESYLRQDRILEAARATGAEAIHPGYGFLSENAEFAEAVIAAGLVWVGAPPAAIRAMGLKDAAKQLMQAAGVPATPGYMGADQSPERLQAEADAIGYPVLIKAVAGGGGKGMRRVDESARFTDALESCRREAASSFGDDRVLIEKYILNPRHIEVQVFGDTFGNVVHLFERDCSLQRRHQKVIEEAPAPGMDAETREQLCATAVKAAQAVDYVGAGTIEFIADASDVLSADRIWFMEMNTRLQVEHPVTEAITGQDLVEWQLRVASGEKLPKRQDELLIDGWAMEARLYSENPATGFLPSIGRLERFELEGGPGGRIDTGVAEGVEISPFYDPMIAKVIAKGGSRDEARSRLSDIISRAIVWPVKTNAAFLVKALAHPLFATGNVDTGLIGRDGEALSAPPTPSAGALSWAASELVQAYPQAGFRLNASPATLAWFALDGDPIEVSLDIPGVEEPRTEVLVSENGQTWELSSRWEASTSGGASSDGAILAPMPGRIVSVEVAEGDAVTAGQKLVVLEAMKMEQALVAPFDGVVEELRASAGGQVTEGTVLAKVVRAA